MNIYCVYIHKIIYTPLNMFAKLLSGELIDLGNIENIWNITPQDICTLLNKQNEDPIYPRQVTLFLENITEVDREMGVVCYVLIQPKPVLILSDPLYGWYDYEHVERDFTWLSACVNTDILHLFLKYDLRNIDHPWFLDLIANPHPLIVDAIFTPLEI